MHSKHTAHRDIKLDNCLLYMKTITPSQQRVPAMKLADFQFVYNLSTMERPKTAVHLGTPVYMAPELLKAQFRQGEVHHNYDALTADIWACGIWLVTVLVGAFPFDHDITVDARTADNRF